jgi:hypothetical protein
MTGCPPGWRSQSKGTFLKSWRGDIIIKFQQTAGDGWGVQTAGV